MSYQYSTQIMIVDTQSSLPSSAVNGQFAFAIDSQQAHIYNGSAWNPTAKVGVKKSGVTVDGKTVGAVTIYTLENSTLNWYPTQIVARAVNISGVTTAPVISMGTDTTNYSNIATGALLPTAMAAVGAGNGLPIMASFSPPLAGGTVIKANVTTAAVATNYSLKYDILGFYDT